MDLNPSAHPEARVLRVAGAASGPFSLKISYCQFVDTTVVINPGDVFAHAVGIRSGRIGGAEFWEAMRDSHILSAIGPIRFDLHHTCEMVKFSYPRDNAGRSLQGQIFRLKNATTGPVRVLGLPDSGEASIRFDLFDQAGNSVKSAATEDLLGDPLLALKDTFPQGQPGSLVTLPQPPGTYFLAVSGFHLLDSWTLLFGENQSVPGQLNAEGLGKPDPAPLLDLGNEPAAVSAAFELMGQPFASHILPGQAFVFIPPFGGWRPEYSMDGEHWSEAGPASDAHLFPSFRALVLPSAGGQYGFIRLRDIAAGQDVLSYTAPRPVSFIAAPTEPGHTYSLESSPDLLDWMFEAPVAGDGGVLEWAMPIVAERMFFRVRSE